MTQIKLGLVLFLAGASFALASPSNMLRCLLAFARKQPVEAKEAFRQADTAFATDALGWNSPGWGFHTVSAWCGSEIHGGCRFCHFVRWLLEWHWINHCKQQAITENLKPWEG